MASRYKTANTHRQAIAIRLRLKELLFIEHFVQCHFTRIRGSTHANKISARILPTTKRTPANNVLLMTKYTSLARTAVKSRDPNPGQLQTISIKAAPLKSAANSYPSRVTIG